MLGDSQKWEKITYTGSRSPLVDISALETRVGSDSKEVDALIASKIVSWIGCDRNPVKKFTGE